MGFDLVVNELGYESFPASRYFQFSEFELFFDGFCLPATFLMGELLMISFLNGAIISAVFHTFVNRNSYLGSLQLRQRLLGGRADS